MSEASPKAIWTSTPRLTAPFTEQLFQRQHLGADVSSHHHGILLGGI